MPDFVDPTSSIIPAPGWYRVLPHQMIYFGGQIRDNYMWQYPILPGAVTTYQQMAAGREFRVSAPTATKAARAVDYLHNAVCRTYDGLEDVGFEAFEKRRVLDYLCIGRTLYYTPDDGPLEYLDPCYTFYNANKRVWYSTLGRRREYPVDDVIVNHPIPIGSVGQFMAPLAFVMPTAMLAWLIREHDRASVDGRKIRDVVIVSGKELADQIGKAMETMLALWSGSADPTKSNIPVIYAESADGVAMEDVVTTIGISSIPQSFDRQEFQFEYVNEIAACLGISLRHFWNSERATNRALEEVQEARQAQKGPSSYVRTEQRLLDGDRTLKRHFGDKVKFGIVEEVDVQSQKVNAEVLKLYSESLTAFAQVFGGQVNGDAFLGWLQGKDILPVDLELVTNMGTLMASDTQGTEVAGEGSPKESDEDPSPITSGSGRSKSFIPEMGHCVVDSNYHVVERRRPVYPVQYQIAREKEVDSELVEEREIETEGVDFQKALTRARNDNRREFLSRFHGVADLEKQIEVTPQVEALFEKGHRFTDEDHRLVKILLNE